jgi:hypothetical protein
LFEVEKKDIIKMSRRKNYVPDSYLSDSDDEYDDLYDSEKDEPCKKCGELCKCSTIIVVKRNDGNYAPFQIIFNKGDPENKGEKKVEKLEAKFPNLEVFFRYHVIREQYKANLEEFGNLLRGANAYMDKKNHIFIDRFIDDDEIIDMFEDCFYLDELIRAVM